MVFDKDMNLLEEISSEYTGPVAQMMCISPPPPPPPPAPSPSPAPAPVSATRRGTGQTRTAASRGRGVLIQSRSPLGITTDKDELGPRKNLLQPMVRQARNFMRLIGGGY